MNPQLCEKACETSYDYLKKCVVCKHAGTIAQKYQRQTGSLRQRVINCIKFVSQKEGLQQRKSGVEE